MCSIITTCKGRLHHLKQSLPAMLAQPNCEIIVVDYACPDGTADYVERHFPQARTLRVTHVTGFNLSDARNRGAALANGERLAFVDADVLLAENFIRWVTEHMPSGRGGLVHCRPADIVFGTAGTCVVSKQLFDSVGGYDDVIRDYASEDTEFYERVTRAARITPIYLPPELIVRAIQHSETERLRFYERSVRSSLTIGLIYRALKFELGTLVPREARQDLYDRVSQAVERAERENLLEVWVDGNPISPLLQARIKLFRIGLDLCELPFFYDSHN